MAGLRRGMSEVFPGQGDGGVIAGRPLMRLWQRGVRHANGSTATPPNSASGKLHAIRDRTIMQWQLKDKAGYRGVGCGEQRTAMGPGDFRCDV
jgi:hypothetical protein